MPPMALRDGEPREMEPLARAARWTSASRSARRRRSTPCTPRSSPSGRASVAARRSFALSLPPEVLERLRELAGASEEGIAAAARRRSRPRHDGLGAPRRRPAASERVRARASPRRTRRWGLGGGIVSTASPAAAAVRLLARGRITARGALPPERCIDPDEMFAELEPRGVRFDVTRAAEEVRGREGRGSHRDQGRTSTASR